MTDTEELLSAQDLIARHQEWKLTLWAAIFMRKRFLLEHEAPRGLPRRFHRYRTTMP